MRFRTFWPLLALLLIEALAFELTSAAALPVTRLSIITALGVLVAGALPAFVRPSVATVLAGALSIVLAAVVVAPFDPAAFDWLSGAVAPVPGLLFRLLNTVALGPLLLHFAAYFPQTRPFSARRLGWCYGIVVALTLALLLAPVGVPRATALVLLLGCELTLLAIAFRWLLLASRAATPAQRQSAQQARLVLSSIALAEALLIVRPIAFALGLGVIPYDIILVVQLALPIGSGYAILRHSLFGIDAVLRRALAYAALSLTLLTLYFGLTEAISFVLVRRVPQFRGLAATVGVVAAAALFEPLRRRVQRLVDRAFYPERLTFQRDLAHARAALARVVRRDAVIALLEDDLPPRLGAGWARLALDPMPEPDDRVAWSAALIVGETTLGCYALGARRSGAGYDAEEQAQLQALIQQAALALAYADTFDALSELNRELEQRVAERTAQLLDQQRALAVADERRRLARDLHDSVTQTVFSLSLGARAIRGLMRRNPAAAVDALGEQEAAAQQALAEMRALLAQLREPESAFAAPASGLADNQEDLIALLAEHCTQLRRQSGLDVSLEAPIALALPATVARELFAVAREALHNVVKHSGVDRATCAVRLNGSAVTLTIADSGCGGAPDQIANGGLGLRGMRERADALGGVLTVHSIVGTGTTVRVHVPLAGSE
jgi:signal transduction histidine kinase